MMRFDCSWSCTSINFITPRRQAPLKVPVGFINCFLSNTQKSALHVDVGNYLHPMVVSKYMMRQVIPNNHYLHVFLSLSVLYESFLLMIYLRGPKLIEANGRCLKLALPGKPRVNVPEHSSESRDDLMSNHEFYLHVSDGKQKAKKQVSPTDGQVDPL